jgi:caffeoyl-CoA O-methyltransferase
MFHDIPKAFLDRMHYLKQVDAENAIVGAPRAQRLRQIPQETGKFIAILAAGAPEGALLEIGTSAGYSTLWLGLACRATARTVTTFEVSREKAELARETFRMTGLDDAVQCVEGDARKCIENYDKISFCFLDAEKEIYLDCYEVIIPHMVKGGILVADNVISHRELLQPFIERALMDERVDVLVVPIGQGELLCRKI